jgi:Zn-dependent M16 (insulinase) family peptidase
MKSFNIPEAYELIRKEDLSDVHSEGYVLVHKKSGAKLALISNDDENKVFYIGFRTPPRDSTGVAHIIEHTVLCGSEKYPLKDPFVELVKGSLNTFLNAMTYPDKTVYPVASTNDQDFANLMDVYMDAVFHPNIYDKPEIFAQEGWHYELNQPEGDLKINGVVYNEMKGAFSNPDDVLERQIMNSLFPDTTYGIESGGDPKVIPSLTREAYLDFHRHFYHPVNSYIYLYGDMDFEERLNYLDREYLSHYDRINLDSSIALQKPFDRMHEVTMHYPVSEGQDLSGQTYLSVNSVIGTALDQELITAFEALEYALLSAPGAPLQKELLSRGIGKDVTGGFDSGTLQPTFSITVKGSDPDKKEAFQETVREVLKDQVKKGVDQKSLEASINNSEFRFREADFGGYPKGLIYGLNILDTWLYDDDQPFTILHSLDVYKEVRKKIGTGYFEKLIQTYLLDNPHASFVCVEPEAGLTVKEDQKLQDELNKYKASLSKDEIEKIIADTRHLKEYQSAPESEEGLRSIPLLKRSDLKKEARPFHYQLTEAEGTDILHSDLETNGILYLTYVYRNVRLHAKDLPVLSFLTKVMGLVDTDKYSYQDLANEINLHLGGLNIGTNIYRVRKKDRTAELTVEIGSKMIAGQGNTRYFLDLIDQMIFYSHFEDKKRVKEILLQEISAMETVLQSKGHVAASLRAQSYFNDAAALSDAQSGIAYYDYLKAFEKDFDTYYEDFRRKALELILMIFRPENLFCHVSGREDLRKEAEGTLPVWKAAMAAGDYSVSQKALELAGVSDLSKADPNELFSKLHTLKDPTGKGACFDLYQGRIPNEGFKTPAKIQYVCRAGDFKKAGFSYQGAMNILKVILGYDYFWINIRVKGGAYGCMSQFKRDGAVTFVTYRDPNLKNSIEVFDKTPDYLKSFDADERDMTKYVIGTISSMDNPLPPSMLGLRDLRMYIEDVPFEEIQTIRDQVLSAEPEDIRALAEPVSAILDQGVLCVIGNEGKLEADKDLFGTLRNLTE